MCSLPRRTKSKSDGRIQESKLRRQGGMEEHATKLVYCVALSGSFGDLGVSEADLIEATYSATVLCSARKAYLKLVITVCF